MHPGTTFVKHKVWDILLREVFTSGASHESDVDVFRPREGGGGEWVRCCPVCIDQDLPDPVISTVQTESGKEYADLPPKLLSVTTIAVPARIPNYDGTEGPLLFHTVEFRIYKELDIVNPRGAFKCATCVEPFHQPYATSHPYTCDVLLCCRANVCHAISVQF